MSKLPVLVRLTVVIGKQILLVFAISVGGVRFSATAAEPALFPLWNTVSPNGQYAIGWSTTGSTKKLPQPYETDSGLENWLINVPTRERIVKLPNSLYWSLPSGMKPGGYDLSAAWASDSSAAVILLDWWSVTDRAFYIEPGSGRLLEGSDQMVAAFKQVLQRFGDAGYRRWPHSYNFQFIRPRLEKRNVFSVVANAAPIKSVAPEPSKEFTYLLTFRVHAQRFLLIKSVDVGH